jgi:hypothetical protein
MDYYDNYYEIDSADRIATLTDCYCTNNTICSSCEKGMY